MKLIKKLRRRVGKKFLRDLCLFCVVVLTIWLVLEFCLEGPAKLNSIRWALVFFVSQLPVFYAVYDLIYAGKLPVHFGIVGLFFWKGLILFGSTLLLFWLALIQPLTYFLTLLVGVFLVTFYSLHLAVRSHSTG